MNGIILRNDDDGALDEVVAEGAYVHLERLDDHKFCLIVEQGGQRVLVDIGAAFGGAARRSEVTASVIENETDEPPADALGIELQMEALGWISLEAHEKVTQALAQQVRALQKQTYAAKEILTPLAEHDPRIREWLQRRD
jgi:hypothetical protein